MAAWLLAGFTMLMLVAALVLAGLDASRMGVARIVFYGILGLAVVVYAGAGCLIVGRVPQRRRLAAVPYRAVAGGQRADGAICAVRAGHGAGVAARGPAGRMVLWDACRAGGRAAVLPRRVVPRRSGLDAEYPVAGGRDLRRLA
jgi:hypothetical protein